MKVFIVRGFDVFWWMSGRWKKNGHGRVAFLIVEVIRNFFKCIENCVVCSVYSRRVHRSARDTPPWRTFASVTHVDYLLIPIVSRIPVSWPLWLWRILTRLTTHYCVVTRTPRKPWLPNGAPKRAKKMSKYRIQLYAYVFRFPRLDESEAFSNYVKVDAWITIIRRVRLM